VSFHLFETAVVDIGLLSSSWHVSPSWYACGFWESLTLHDANESAIDDLRVPIPLFVGIVHCLQSNFADKYVFVAKLTVCVVTSIDVQQFGQFPFGTDYVQLMLHKKSNTVVAIVHLS
jgi:hypothetical protein